MRPTDPFVRLPGVERLDVQLVRGDSWSGVQARWLDASGVPVPIASARMQVRDSTDGERVLLELTESAGITYDSTNGWLTPAITATQSAALRSGVWDLEATAQDARVKTLVGGSIEVVPDVSR